MLKLKNPLRRGTSSIKWKLRNDIWEVTPDGKLLINETSHTPFDPWTKQDLATRLARMQEKIANSGYPIIIRAVAVEWHIATSLWNKGEISTEALMNAVPAGNGVEIDIELLGQSHKLWICAATYYTDYEFIVEGHPQGHVRIRDVPDPLAIVAGEQVF